MKKFAISSLLALTLALGAVVPASADAPLVTITGTVVSNSDGVLTLRTDKGDLRFDLDKSTEMPANIAVGNRVTVSYDADDKMTDKMDARKIVMAPEVTTPAPTTPVTQSTPQPTTSSVQQETVQQETVQEDESELPATAGPLPMLGGAGILALIGAFLLRRRARRV